MARRWAWLGLVGGCYTPPNLPLVDEVPLESTVQRCANSRYEWARCVLDGDTFTTVDCGAEGGSVRLLSLDAPEVAHGGSPAANDRN